MITEHASHLKTETDQTSALENSSTRSIPAAKIPTSFFWTRTSPDIVKIQDDDPVAGTGLFAHNCAATIPYHLLLSRFYLQRDFHPSLNTYCEATKTLLKPHVVPIGNKRTILANFPEISRGFEDDTRDKHHLALSIFKQLGTSGTLHPRDVLVLRGRFRQGQIERVVSYYNRTYVLCSECESRDTLLWQGEKRGWFITCQNCGAEHSVPGVNFVCTLKVTRPRQKAPKEPEKEAEAEAAPESIPESEPRVFRKPEIKSKL
ncbi:domain found in IF2B/IF5-domain-containing protein [Lophiotrema nucula]|uniref:Domain found in IF2B/IF5-domain-containing protein n=1 Tax=Lophiotrema nucula TaxID=690887 RepID=A0A6A5Z3V6_9PLEO|nr:domain found in IF2B/IF5-domain-containing protein [Lophiotrema nucula]